jgi:hypothetical protein
LYKDIPVRKRHHASSRPLPGTNNPFQMALKARHLNSNLSSEHVNRPHAARRASFRAPIELVRTQNMPLKTFNTTTIKTGNESSGAVKPYCSRFTTFAMAVSGDTYSTWQKN